MLNSLLCSFTFKGRRGRERMVVEFTTTHAISAYHNSCCEFEYRSGQGVQQFTVTVGSSTMNKTHNPT
jgi:hypothetical protein